MNILSKIALFSGLSGCTVLLGGILSYFYGKSFRNNKHSTSIFHFITAFGDGIIISALTLVLIPNGMENLSLINFVVCFAAGALIFALADQKLKNSGSQLSQLMAMLLDYIPEAIALGAIFGTEPKTGMLLAIFIGLQNLPEAFNSYRDLELSGFKPSKSFVILSILSCTGLIAAFIGYFFLSGKPIVTAALMTFASGGILYLIFEDVAPSIPIKNKWTIALGSNFGFLVGVIGEKLMG